MKTSFNNCVCMYNNNCINMNHNNYNVEVVMNADDKVIFKFFELSFKLTAYFIKH